jgi:putative flippase GtrA
METGAAMAEILGVVADTGAAVLFLIFMYLWHKRTVYRDAMFNETLQSMMRSLMDCVKATMEK